MTAGALPDRLARAITLGGPIPLSQFMASANADYYTKGTAIGGDFVTAPEISQMFGELVGAWVADLVARAGVPHFAFVELGPGRGTLAVDASRMLERAGLAPPVHLVETSPALRDQQRLRLPDAAWHDDVTTLPDDLPLVVIANEFFDALPVEQLIRGVGGWHRRLVACQDTLFLPIAGPLVPDAIVPERLRDAAPGSVIETSPAAVGVVRRLGRKVAAQGGALLVIDYGYEGPVVGETLQAVRGHRFANPYDLPGSVDLSAHVDFGLLAAAGVAEGLGVHGPAPQRDFLGRLGLAGRAAALARRAPERGEEIAATHARLTGEEAMGTLFKAIALTAPGWPVPEGFA